MDVPTQKKNWLNMSKDLFMEMLNNLESKDILKFKISVEDNDDYHSHIDVKISFTIERSEE